MKPQIFAALFLTFVLISGAFYLRNKESNDSALTAISDNPLASPLSQNLNLPDPKPTEESADAPANMTITDLVARQLFSDYFSMASNKSVTPQNIENLAKKYAENIASLDTGRRYTLLDLRIVGTSQSEINKYDKSMGEIYTLYQTRLVQAAATMRGVEPSSPEFQNASRKISAIYNEASGELLRMPVPSTFAKVHLKLINNYLSNVAAFGAVAQIVTDPLSSFAGLVTVDRNAEEEGKLWSELTKLIASGGIITRNP